jgi:cell pole-organizing protein PopZ
MGDIQQDPSMEEILASIKRVIREDGRAPAQGGRAVSRRNGRTEPAPPAPAAAPAPPPAPPEEDVLELDDPVEAEESLISSNAAAASRQSLAALTAMRAAPSAPASDGGALENVVRDMLRPMLKDWLEEHLPQIVESWSPARSRGSRGATSSPIGLPSGAPGW